MDIKLTNKITLDKLEIVNDILEVALKCKDLTELDEGIFNMEREFGKNIFKYLNIKVYRGHNHYAIIDLTKEKQILEIKA